ncbi:MAG: transposase [Gammaproteobacteria bacterium]|nr:transposase [Gammaproteobacteria bacterium]
MSDNIYIERFWRSFKYEEFYLNAYEDIQVLRNAISAYIEFYNNERFHQSINYKTPVQLYRGEH